MMLFLSACAAPTKGAKPVEQANLDQNELSASESASQMLAGDNDALALVFDPVSDQPAPALVLDRDIRRQRAYWGMQGPVVTWFYQRTDDKYGMGWQSGSLDENYQRRTIEVKMSTSVR